MSQQKEEIPRADTVNSVSDRPHSSDAVTQNSDDEPMVYETPRDYKTWANEERDRRLANGEDPDKVVLQSDLRNLIQRREDEPADAYVKRYVAEMNAMISRGVQILNDQCVADVQASVFGTADGRTFDLGPGSGATKKEFREFSQWFSEMSEDGRHDKVPEKWAKFEKTGSEAS